MSKQSKLKELILTVLGDGENHTSKEIRELALARGLIRDREDGALRQAVFSLKREYDNIVSPRIGEYRMNNDIYESDGKSNFQRALEFTKTMMEDGEVHNVSEIREGLAHENIDVVSSPNLVSNVMYKLKEGGVVKKLNGIGEYQKVREEKREENTVGNKIDRSKYYVIHPQNRHTEMKITINEKGILRMNSVFLKKAVERKYEILLAKDIKSILMIPKRDGELVFTKAGELRNKEIVKKLREKKVSFPASYIIYWNEDIQAWEGEISKAFPK